MLAMSRLNSRIDPRGWVLRLEKHGPLRDTGSKVMAYETPWLSVNMNIQLEVMGTRVRGNEMNIQSQPKEVVSSLL